MRHPRLASFVIALALATTPALAQRRSWVVDPANGAGTDFTSLQAAADAAVVAPGDILLLRDGDHGTLATSKPLVVIGTGVGGVSHVDVSAIPAGSAFVWANQTMYGPAPGAASMQFTNCAGRIAIVNTPMFVAGSFPQNAMRPLVEATDCRDVEIVGVVSPGAGLTFTRSTAIVRNCQLSGYTRVNSSFIGRTAITATDSTIEFVDSNIAGSGGDLQGGYGAVLQHCRIRVVGSSSINQGPSPSGAGYGIALGQSNVEVGPNVGFGPLFGDSNLLVRRPLPSLRLTLTGGIARATVALPTTITTSFPAVVAFGFAQPPVDLGAGGILRLDPTLPLCALTAGNTLGGVLNAQVAVPNSSRLVGVDFAAQGIVLFGDAVRLTNGALLTIL